MSFLSKLSNWYFKRKALPYWTIFLADCLIVFLSYLITYLLFRPKIVYLPTSIFWPLAGWALLRFLIFSLFYIVGMRIFKTYDGILRYSSMIDLMRVGGAMAVGGVIAFIAHYPFFSSWQFSGLPAALEAGAFELNIRTRDIVVATFLATLIMWFVRMYIKTLYDSFFAKDKAVPTIIYGIQHMGVGIAKRISTEKPARFALKGFLTDIPEYAGSLLMGKHVHIVERGIVDKMKADGIKALLVTPINVKRFKANEDFVDALIDAGIKIYLVQNPEVYDKDAPVVPDATPLKIEELLSREEIEIDLDAIRRDLFGKVVFVSGSAGSIGSELVDQIACFQPARMVLVDSAETPQHDLLLMMRKKHPDIEAHILVTSVCKESAMEELFRRYQPNYVYHAAAYKHVPMMEDNPCEAVQNNVRGTQILADLSVKYGVDKFVMISTDKAVNPSNVMGCSKRICEIYTQSLDAAIKSGTVKGHTKFVTTRFGNVLGWNGSVIPLFRKQIYAGGPVTVTHPDIIRYFMLICEAVKLVLEAGTMSQGGEVYVFDMGQPVRIADLAKRMIKMIGAEGVEIQYTGLREGEKLYEELLTDKEITKPTSFHSKIHIATVPSYDYERARTAVNRLYDISLDNDAMATVKEMKRIVPEFVSQNSPYSVLDEKSATPPADTPAAEA